MAENQTRAQVILEANTAAFMAQIRSVGIQIQNVFNRVFSTIRLPALLGLGGLVAGTLTMPTTGRTIGEAVQMQRLHAQLDRLNATLVAELAPIRMLVLRILITLLGTLNAGARILSNLMEKIPELGDAFKGLVSIIAIFYAFRILQPYLGIFGRLLLLATKGLAGFIFRILGFRNVFNAFRARGINPFITLSTALTFLFNLLEGPIIRFGNRLTSKLYALFQPGFFGDLAAELFALSNRINLWVARLFLSLRNIQPGSQIPLGKFITYLAVPFVKLGSLLLSIGRVLLIFLDILTAGIVALIGALVPVFGVLGTIALAVAVIVGAISAIYLIVVAFKYIAGALQWLGSVLWAGIVWIGQMLYFAGQVVLMILRSLVMPFLSFIGSLLLSLGKMLLGALGWIFRNLIVAPLAALWRWIQDALGPIFEKISDWFNSLFEQPPFSIQGMSSFGGFTKEELELASPRLPELINIGGTAVNLLDQIRKLLEQQRSAAIKRVSGI